MSTLMQMDLWATTVARRLAAQHGVRASEVYRGLLLGREAGMAPEAVEHAVEIVCDYAAMARVPFDEAVRKLQDMGPAGN